MQKSKYCVIIPVYNNVKDIEKVIDKCKSYLNHIIVIDDGSTDGTTEIIQSKDVSSYKFSENRGKGAAIKKGFSIARERDYNYAITIDGDGQHHPHDIPRFIEASKKYPNNIIIGARIFNENVTRASKIGLFFSNFFFYVSTFQKIADTQSGYRLYPINLISTLNILSNAFDFEIEVIVKAYWQGIYINSIIIDSHYEKPEDRVSHLKVGRDGWKGIVVYFKLLFQAVYKLHLFKYRK